MNTEAAWIIATGIALGGLFAGGVYRVVAPNDGANTVYVVNSITGSASLCYNANGSINCLSSKK